MVVSDERGNEPVSLADEEAVRQVVSDSILKLWDAVNNLARIRPSRRERYRVTLFGSARARPGTFAYEETKRVAEIVASLGCDIITGGGPGLMQAANEGAAAGGGKSRSVGIRVDLPFEQEVNAFVGMAFEHRTFFTRLHQFVITSDAFVVAPGGIGTVLETLMIWQLLQVKHLKDTPLILVGSMWPGLVQWARASMLSTDPPLAGAADLEIPRCVATGDEAITILKEHHERWRSGGTK
ncbi:MAG TPA: LOG family protein [Candidatus Polarisedimenticolia bacterium]|nr:LOG family protein [Candidatus Polarisedimenticolia bacterium]